MEKSTYFYTIDIPSTRQFGLPSLQSIFNTIFNAPHSKLNNGIWTYEYNDGTTPIRVDMISQDENLGFYRIGRELNVAFAVKRDRSTLQAENILNNNEVSSKIPDHTTFFLIDFQHGILSFVNSQAAPNARNLTSIAHILFSDLFLEVLPIVNPNRIDALYKRDAVLSELEISLPMLSPEMLAALDVPHNTIQALMESSAARAKITIKAEPYKPVAKSRDLIQNILRPFKNSSMENSVKARGSEPGSKGQLYSFTESQIVYKVELPTIATTDGTTRPLTQKEILNAAMSSITNLYNIHKNDLRMYANRFQ